MRTQGRWARPTLRMVTDHYLRYILIWCPAYTSERTVAERIAAYTLIASSLLAGRLRRSRDLSLVIDTMVQIVAHDQVSSFKFEVSRGPTHDFALHTSNFKLAAAASSASLLPAPLCQAAGAINAMKRFCREVMVLRHIEGLSVEAVAQMHGMPSAAMAAAIDDAKHEFTALLFSLGWDHEIRPDVHGVLTDLAASLDESWAGDVAECARQYLAQYRPWP
jgi:DNA-directed RNA polymerase specialized sigma24 family protein